MSSTRAGEGTLRVLPNIKIASAYILLRPFFRAIKSREQLNSDKGAYLALDNWVLDLDGTAFPGSVPGAGENLTFYFFI